MKYALKFIKDDNDTFLVTAKGFREFITLVKMKKSFRKC